VRLSLSRRTSIVLVLLLTLLGAGAGYALEAARGPQFQASTDVLVRFWSVEAFLLTGQSSTVSSADVSDAATLAGSRDVLRRAAADLRDGRDATELNVSVAPSSSSNAVTITATATDAATAEATSEAVAAAMIDALSDRITASADAVAGQGDFAALLEQRSQVLTESVRPLVALGTTDATQTSPAYVNVAAFGIVGLAAGVLLVIGLRFARPTIDAPRIAQRIVERPAVGFGEDGSAEAARLVRRLLDDRPRGTVLVVPVDVEAEKTARTFVDWARKRSTDVNEAARVVSSSDPAGTVLAPRPRDGEVAAVLLLAPKGTTRRALTDAATLLSSWWPVDAVVVPA
jgi:capsular polysaccharide biosynthesis protein